MDKTLNVAAVDLGASSGRVMQVYFNEGQLKLVEVHRFPNKPVKILNHLHWDVLYLFDEIKLGLGKANKESPLSSLGIDSWGVDFALLDKAGSLVSNPYHYRDPRTNGVMEKVFERVGKEEIFERTGLQFMQMNSLYQLFSMQGSALLDTADSFLMMPDLFNYWLTGLCVNEYTDATTTQFYNPKLNSYDLDMLSKLDLPTSIFPEIIPPGTILGPVLPSVCEDIGLLNVDVIAPACHDTGSAVAAAPITNPNAAFISSGTWSLVGVEVENPVINSLSLKYNFTNEGGVGGSIRLLKNVAGMWLAQECKRIWEQEGSPMSWEKITHLAATAKPFGPSIDPDHGDFLNPSDMSEAIKTYCNKTGQLIPDSISSILRCIFESLALKYRWVLGCLEEMLGYEIEVIHIIGGGSRNEFLCELTANAVGKPVIAGPVEATAIGNALIQAISLGCLENLSVGRSVVMDSFPIKVFKPNKTDVWDEKYGRFVELLDIE